MSSFSLSTELQRPARELKWFSLLALAGLVLAITAMHLMAQTPEAKPSQKLTEKDRELAINHLKASREKFAKSVVGLSEAQLKFKSAPDRWSVAEVAEHITVTEGILFNLLTNKSLKSPATPDKERKVTDDQLVAMMTDRSSKAQASEQNKPTGRWKTVAETMQEFEKERARTIDFVKTTTTDLRSHFSSFGPLGEVDALQWVLLISGHCERHIAQINEVKADPNFPKK
jgi:hypothetical protein